MERNKLTHAVLWPNGAEAAYSLVSPDGEVIATVALIEPVKGSDLSRLMPDGFEISLNNATLVFKEGRYTNERQPFDTVVITERREVTLDQRLARLEMRDINRQKALTEAKRAHAKAEARLAEVEAQAVIEAADEAARADAVEAEEAAKAKAIADAEAAEAVSNA